MKPTNAELEFMTKVAETLYLNEFHKAVEARSTFRWIDNELDNVLPMAEFHSGCTKGVFVFPDCDWVLKVPLSQKDYCALEAEVYEDAIEAKLEHCFAACYFLTSIGNQKYYIQEKATCCEDGYTDLFYEAASNCISREEYDDEDEYLCDLDTYVNEIDAYESINAIFNGSSYLGSLWDFINHHNLNDFHAGNYGYIYGKGDVLIDYSGY